MGKKGYKIIGIIFLIIVLLAIFFIVWYIQGTKAPNNNENKKIDVEISSGMRTTSILTTLKENKVIKNDLVAKIYIKLHEVGNLKAGKYSFTGNENLEQVLEKIVSGNVIDETITITFKEGKNMRYIASTIADNTNNTMNDVYKLLEDKDFIVYLKDKYWFLTEEIQNENIYYPLEGYLYPDTYTFDNIDVKVSTIFEKMLAQTDKILTKYKDKFQEGRPSVHQILTLASLVELEGNKLEDRQKISSVFYNRLANNMSLGSDVTTYYAIRVDMGERQLYSKEINTYNAYNTRGPEMSGKLPIGPICNPSEEAIEAAINPTQENYLYFVADKTGDMYFSKTYEEHQQIIANLKKKGLWYEYEN